MKTHWYCKTLSIILVLALLISSMPTQAFALLGDAVQDMMQSKSAPNTVKKDVYEVTKLREKNVKHFKLEDGTYAAVQYDEAVHTQDSNGNWQDIDNRLAASGSEFTTSNARIKFAKKITGNEVLFTLHDGNRKITMSLDGAIKKTAGSVTNTKTSFDKTATPLQKMMTLDNLSSKILYSNILNGVDLEYVVESLNVKENIIVKERCDNYQYTFTIKLNNLEAAMDTDGSVNIYDPTSKETVYHIPVGFMYDANYEYCDAVSYSLTSAGQGKYALTISADTEWINSENRAFPVYIDPTITVDGSHSYEATSIHQWMPDENGTGLDFLAAGNLGSAYVKLKTLPTLPAEARITNAQFTVSGCEYNDYYPNSSYSLNLGIYQVISNWDSATFCYNQYSAGKSGQIAPKAIDAQSGADKNKRYSWNITQCVWDWYNYPSANYGIAIQSLYKNTQDDLFRFRAEGLASALYISYSTLNGIEDYWSYTTQNAGTAGTGYVNNATGRLVFSIDTLSTTDSLFSFAANLIYDQSYAGKHITASVANVPNISPTAGYGFKINVNEYLIPKTYRNPAGENIKYYIWTDSDGTAHDFYPEGDSTNTYKDNDGLQMTLEAANANFTITDRNHTVRTFDRTYNDRNYINDGALLSRITDKSGNVLNFVYTTWGRVTEVQVIPKGSSPISFLQLSYNQYGQIKCISNAVANQKVNFYYSNQYNSANISSDNYGYLRKVQHVYQDKIVAETTYNYNDTGKLTEAHDVMSNRTVRYSYNGNQIVKIAECSGNTAGQILTVKYKENYTEVYNSGADDLYGNNDDIVSIYNFDYRCRVTSTYSTDRFKTKIYGASSGEYETQDNVKNNIKTAITLGGAASNYIVNGGFEDTSVANGFSSSWRATKNVAYVNAGEVTHDYYSARFNLVRNSSDMLSQIVSLPSGKYTLSLDVVSNYAVDANAYIRVKSLNDSNRVYTQAIPLNESKNSTGSVNTGMTFEALNYNSTGSEQFEISIIVTTGAHPNEGAAYITVDNIMLEESIGQSGYSMVEFGNFEEYSITADGKIGSTYSHYWHTLGEVVKENALMGNVLKIDPNAIANDTDTYQTVYRGEKDDRNFGRKTFIVSGMAKGTYQIASGDFGINVHIYYADNTSEVISLDFQSVCTEWQFVSKSFTTKDKEIGRIVLHLVYKNNPGVAYFDNIFMTQAIDNSYVNTEYYGNGLVQIKKNGFYEEVYEYDEKDNLSRVANSRGEIYDYTYTSDNSIFTETYYTFKNNIDNSLSYPYQYENADALITKVLVTETVFNYNACGQKTSSITYEGVHHTAPNSVLSKTTCVTSSYYYDTHTGSRTFGALLSETDNLGTKTKHYYDSANGNLLATVNYHSGTGICYTYDPLGNLTSAMPATYNSSGNYDPVLNAEKVEYGYNEANLLHTITTGSTTYTFHYDGFGKSESTFIGGKKIVGYEYNANNGKLKTIRYENGFSVKYVYDELESISEVWYIEDGVETKVYTYKYDVYGQLHRFDNLLTGMSIVYRYDCNKRLTGYTEFKTDDMTNSFSSTILYNDKSQIRGQSYQFTYVSGHATSDSSVFYWMTYNDDDSLNSYRSDATGVSGGIDYSYDAFKRLCQKESSYKNWSTDSHFSNTVKYMFGSNGTATSTRVDGFSSSINGGAPVNYTYTYDRNGNITKTQISIGAECRYYYDDLGHLIREDNTALGATYVYIYDNAGNILTKRCYGLTAANSTPTSCHYTYTYGYNDADWGDKLTSYRGVSFTYDEIGNPLTYYNGTNWSFTWENGKQLSTAVGNGHTLSFAYNNEGVRTSKIVDGIKHIYHLNGSQIISEEWGPNLLVFLYDADGSPIGMQYRNTSYAKDKFDTYWFEKNLQNDVVAVYDENGTKLITYTYDAWGNFSVDYHNGGDNSTANYNPFRYRGYYYDNETGLYYVSSRYYDPQIGRFINADDIQLLGANSDFAGLNLFAYCGNNPVSRADNHGQFWNTVIGAVAGAIVGGISAALSGTDITAGMVSGAISGGLGGVAVDLAIAFPAIPVVVSLALTTIVSGMGGAAGSYVNQRMNGKSHAEIDGAGIAIDGVWSGIGGLLSFGAADVGGKTCRTLAQNLALRGQEFWHQVGSDFATTLTITFGTWFNTVKMNLLREGKATVSSPY